MSHDSAERTAEGGELVSAGALAPWPTGDLPPPPRPGWRLWIGLLGPGVVLAGTSIGSGEWLFGPAVSAQYGANLLWLATMSIVLQVFCNLTMMRYALYSGEPIVVGGLRTWPGPTFWICVYAFLDLAAIWPYNASNAAVPVAAAWLGHLPTEADFGLVKAIGYAIFILAFVPLVFGGTVYRVLEKVMAFKLVFVLGFLISAVFFMVSPSVMWEVLTGFGRFGTVPLRAESIVAGRHFTLSEKTPYYRVTIKGFVEADEPVITNLRVFDETGVQIHQGAKIPDKFASIRDRVLARQASFLARAMRDSALARAKELARPGRFYVATLSGQNQLEAHGAIDADQSWRLEHAAVDSVRYDTLSEMSEPHAGLLRQLLDNRGLERVTLPAYVGEHGRLPPLDWPTLVAFCAIAGAGGLTNTIFSNYARDKGWGMGTHVGAIPSAVGGRTIALSHVGRVFLPTPDNMTRWRGWLRHIFRDQVAVWMLCSFLGMALPCMLSLEFIRNSTVENHRVAGMMAEGMAERYPDYRGLLWAATLLCGFMVLAPGQISIGDQIARRWTDIIWTTSAWARQFEGTRVKYVYYGILSIYGVWGLIALALFDPMQTAKIGAVLGNVALGCSALHAWYVNKTLMPRVLQPNWFLQAGVIACGLFFLLLSVIVVATL